MKRKIILTVSLFLMLLTLFALSINAAEPIKTWDISATSSDNVTAYLYNDTENEGYYTLTISGQGEMKSFSSAPWYSYKSKIKSVTIEEGVTNIGKSAFHDCTSLTSVAIPDSVTTIGSWAFRTCRSLSSVKIPDVVTTIGDYAFYYCESLTSVAIPDGVTTIGDYAFYYCRSLTTIVIPKSVTTIGSGAFSYCDSLIIYCEAASQPSGWNSQWVYPALPIIWNCNNNDRATDGNIYAVIDGLRYALGRSGTATVLKQSTSIKKADIPSKITYKDVVYTVTTIDDEAFSNCTSLESIVIPNSVTTIGSSAFIYCYSLTSIEIPDSVTKIYSQAFYNCDSLTSVVIPSSVKTIDYGTFRYCDSLTSVIIRDGVTTIGEAVFADCPQLKSVVIGDSVASIGSQAFYNCTSLISVEFGESVTTIGSSAFYNCTSLTSVELPSSVTSISTSAFSYCKSLKSIEVNEKNTAYCDIDGNLYTKDKATLIQYAVGRNDTTFIVPDSVTTIETSAFQYCSYLASVVIGDSVTTIGSSAFSGCTSLSSVEIGDSVTAIPYEAFYSCTSLTSVVIGDSVETIGNYAFYYCPSLTSIVIPNSVKSIGEYAFRSCTSLKSAVIGNGVTDIKTGTFYECSSLKSVVVGNSVTTIGTSAFYKCESLTSVVIPNSVTKIFAGAFRGCTSLKSAVIGDGVTSIGDNAFYECKALESVTIGAGVTTIGKDAFNYCSSLTKLNYMGDIACLCNISFYNVYSNPLYYAENLYINNKLVTDVVIPNNVTSINKYVFYNCTSLTSIVIPNGVTTIGERAFYSCRSLTSVAIPDSVTTIGDSAFKYCTSLTSVAIPDSVTTIGDSAFSNCSSLTSVVIPDSVTTIGNSALYNCTSLTSVVISANVTTIGSDAFYRCSSLTSIVIPDSVTAIGSFAFSDCTSLTSIFIPDSVTTIGSDAFNKCYSLTIYAEDQSQPSGWNSRWNKSNCPVVWDCNNNDIATDGYIYTVIDGIRYGIKDGVATVMRQASSTRDANICDSIEYKGTNYSVTSIGENAFFDGPTTTPYYIANVVIPNSVISIGYQAFRNCEFLTSIVIPDSVTTIGAYAFRDCDSLIIYCEAQIKPSEWDSSWKDSICPVVWNCNNNDKATDGYIYTVVDGVRYGIKDGVATVVRQASTIKEANIRGSIYYSGTGYSVTSIVKQAFYRCTFLTSVEIPNSVTSIGEDAFGTCFSLTSIVIPDSVTTINSYAFSGCSSLTIYAEATSKPSGWDSNWNYSNRPVVWGYVHQHTEVEIPAVRPAPSNNHTGWSAGVMCSDCGETLVAPVEMVAGTSSDVNFKINSATLSLGEDIGVTYNATHPANSSADSMYMVFLFDGKEFFVESAGVVTGNRYRFVFKGMRADLMAANIEAYVYAIENGNYVMKSHLQYSVKQYCVNQLKRTIDAKFETLIYSVLNLGDCTQLAVNSETPAEQLVSKIVTAETGKVVPGVAVETIDPSYNVQAIKGDRTQGYDWKSGGIALGSSVKLKLQFTASDVKGLVLKFDIAGERTIEIDASDLKKDSNDRYTVYFQVKVLEYDDTITCTFQKDGKQVGSTLTYSVYTYLVRSYTNNNLPEADRSFMKALYEYAEAVKSMNE